MTNAESDHAVEVGSETVAGKPVMIKKLKLTVFQTKMLVFDVLLDAGGVNMAIKTYVIECTKMISA